MNKKTIFSIALISTLLFVCFSSAKTFFDKTVQETKKPMNSKTSFKHLNSKLFNYKLRDISGKKFKINTFKEKIIIIDFWATWCPPCIKEIPHFIELQKKYNDVQVIGISLDTLS